ncbi:hypothetical protein [Microbacterium sp.]|uniref:hypothetical protein n=1 Tax=Microbacterium sp. TaxID=51671 RepID=UPI003561AB7C
MTIENYIVLAVGFVAVVCGPLIVRNRVKVFQLISDTQRALGGAVGRAVAAGSSPFWIGFAGVGLMIIGLVAIGAGIFGRDV